MGEIPGRMNHSHKNAFSKWHGNDYLETAGQPFSDEKLLFFRLRYFSLCLSHAVN